MFGAGVTATLMTRTRSGVDSLGNDKFTIVSTTIPNCAFDPGGSVESVQGQDLLTTTPTLFVPPGVTVGHIDSVTVGALTYEVDGSPNTYVSPFTGSNPGTVVKLKDWTG